MCTSFDLLRSLHALNAAGFSSCLRALQDSGSLAAFLRDLTPALKLAFLDLCEARGLVCAIPTLEASTTVADPPAAPRLLVNRGDLPRALRLLVHEENITRTNRHAAEYRAYLSRFCALVDDAQSPEALRALGPVAPALVPGTEPGLDFDGDDDLVWDFDRRVERLDDSAITHRVHVKTFQFRDAA